MPLSFTLRQTFPLTPAENLSELPEPPLEALVVKDAMAVEISLTNESIEFAPCHFLDDGVIPRGYLRTEYTAAERCGGWWRFF